jgi:hypothetical protein
MFMAKNKISNNINMNYSKNKCDNVDFELDLTSDNKIYYIDESDDEVSKNNFHKDEIHFVNKLIDFGFFLSGFVIVYAILKIKNNYKKIEFNEDYEIKKLYHKKIYKKNKINSSETKEL